MQMGYSVDDTKTPLHILAAMHRTGKYLPGAQFIIRTQGSGIHPDRFHSLWRLTTHVYYAADEALLLHDINLTYQPPSRIISSDRFYDHATVPTRNIPRADITSDIGMVDDDDLDAVVYSDADTRTAAQLVAASIISSTAAMSDVHRHIAIGHAATGS